MKFLKLISLFFFVLIISCDFSNPNSSDDENQPPEVDNQPPIIEDYSGYEGKASVNDSIFMLFDDKINVNYIERSDNENLIEDFIYFADSCGVKFDYPDDKLGGECSFRYSVSDSIDNTTTQNFSVSYLPEIVEFDQYVKDFFVDDNNEYCYVYTSHPYQNYHHKLHVVSLNDFQIISEIEIDNRLNFFQINPYDNHLYYSYKNEPKIYIVDPLSLEFIRTIYCEPSQHNNYIDDLSRFGCASSGHMFVTMARDTRALEYRVYDLAINDSSYVVVELYELQGKVHNSYNYEKFLILSLYGLGLDILDPQTCKFEHYWLSGVSQIQLFKPSKTRNSIFVAGLYQQTIYDYDGNNSNFSYWSSFDETYADFSYRDNEMNLIYYYNTYYGLHLLDYENQETIFECNFQYGFQPKDSNISYINDILHTTTDDKFLIVSNENKLLFHYMDNIRSRNDRKALIRKTNRSNTKASETISKWRKRR